MMYWLPFALILVLLALVAVMPWSRPHPNHRFILKLLDAPIGDHWTVSLSRRMNTHHRGSSFEASKRAA